MGLLSAIVRQRPRGRAINRGAPQALPQQHQLSIRASDQKALLPPLSPWRRPDQKSAVLVGPLAWPAPRVSWCRPAPSPQVYGRERSRFGLIRSCVDQALSTVLLCCGYLPWLWHTSTALGARWLGTSAEDEIAHSLILVAVSVALDTALSLPWDLWSEFVIEERHGFNRQTLRLFASDLAKSLVLGAIIGGPILAVVLWVIRWGGPSFYWYVWGIMFVFQVCPPPPSPPTPAPSAQISATTKRGCKPWAGSPWGPGNRGADLLLPLPPQQKWGRPGNPQHPPPPSMPSHAHCRLAHGDRGPSPRGKGADAERRVCWDLGPAW